MKISPYIEPGRDYSSYTAEQAKMIAHLGLGRKLVHWERHDSIYDSDTGSTPLHVQNAQYINMKVRQSLSIAPSSKVPLLISLAAKS